MNFLQFTTEPNDGTLQHCTRIKLRIISLSAVYGNAVFALFLFPYFLVRLATIALQSLLVFIFYISVTIATK